MNILIPDEWLRVFLKTSATQKQIAGALTLCGPSVEKIEDSTYSIEITTNRVDTASVFGIAREAHAILPQFGIKASLHPIKKTPLKFKSHVGYLYAMVDPILCPRFTAALIKKVKIGHSPDWVKKRLEAVGVRPLNNVVDISNYVMHELGQPVHTFDYDKIKGARMVLRASKKGERLKTLDGKTHTLAGGDIVIEDGTGRLIDLAGIMGGENSAVDDKTQNILLFVQTYNPVAIRRTSMSLAQRTEAAELFEKSLDTELVTLGISRGIELFSKLTGGIPQKEILDIYPRPFSGKKVTAQLELIEKRLGITISKGEITSILKSLGFDTKWEGSKLEVNVPSFREKDISIPEDIVEEVARIYGYHKLPSRLMEGGIPTPPKGMPFSFEGKIKDLLSHWGGIEVYASSLVGKDFVGNSQALKLKNPLGPESEYLRTSLMPSLIAAANQNKGSADSFHLFEVANIYLPKGTIKSPALPDEKMVAAGIFYKVDYRRAKGVIEALLEKLNVPGEFIPDEKEGFAPSKYLAIKSLGKVIGEMGILENKDLTYWEFDLESLRAESVSAKRYIPIPKFPPQIEDITLVLPERTRVGEVLEVIKKADRLISTVELTDIFKNSFTFRINYQDPSKTLTDAEIIQIRKRILVKLQGTFGANLKS